MSIASNVNDFFNKEMKKRDSTTEMLNEITYTDNV